MTARPAPKSRIEYLGFVHLDGSREYRYVVHSATGSCGFSYHIGLGAFVKAQLLLQDGPDVCYRQLERELAEGDNLQEGARYVRDDELRAYRDAHATAPRKTFAAAAARTGAHSPAPATDDGVTRR